MLPIPKDEQEERAIENIKRTGLHILQVFSNEGAQGFSYSVGLGHTYQQAEIIVYSLAAESALDIINLVAEKMKNGSLIKNGMTRLDILNGFECYFGQVDKKHYADHFGWAKWFNGYTDDFDVLQLVWPDKSGNFPWSSNYDLQGNIQPLLFEK